MLSTQLCADIGDVIDHSDEGAALAQQLSNPVAALISAPIQANYDENFGPDDKGSRWLTNIQPVIPITLNDEWNLISRTIQPIIIMMALPLSIIGVMLALFLSGQQFSLFVMIGFMLLMGMVGKNAVLLVDFANAAMSEGKSADEALIEAGEKRLRPILMTTIAMIFAMLPLAFATGLGSETNSPMAVSVIGGLLSSMVLTLLVVPVMYRLINPADRWLRKWYENGKAL